VEPEIGDYFFPFFMDFCFLGAQDLRLDDDHNEDKFRPNNRPDRHFCLMDQIPPERRRSYTGEVQAGSC
jgi:hypothetical protein